MPAMRRSKAPSARFQAKVHLVQTVEDVGLLQVKDPDKLAYITQTTLSVDDTRGIIAGADGALSGHRRAGRARHLLCDAEPPAGGARPGA